MTVHGVFQPQQIQVPTQVHVLTRKNGARVVLTRPPSHAGHCYEAFDAEGRPLGRIFETISSPEALVGDFNSATLQNAVDAADSGRLLSLPESTDRISEDVYDAVVGDEFVSGDSKHRVKAFAGRYLLWSFDIDGNYVNIRLVDGDEIAKRFLDVSLFDLQHSEVGTEPPARKGTKRK